jgi:hypothetical protein
MSQRWSNSRWKERLRGDLEPLLLKPSLRDAISTYRGVPFALFAYPPTAELELRREVENLRTRLNQETPREVHVLSLATLRQKAIAAAFGDPKRLYGAERAHMHLGTRDRLSQLSEQLEQVLSDPGPLPIAAQIVEYQKALDPDRSLLFLTRVGAVYPAYRASALLENLMGDVHPPTVLFYPGTRTGKNSLRFMDSLDAVHSYRHKIY